MASLDYVWIICSNTTFFSPQIKNIAYVGNNSKPAFNKSSIPSPPKSPSLSLFSSTSISLDGKQELQILSGNPYQTV